jgi:hypothetical protein
MLEAMKVRMVLIITPIRSMVKKDDAPGRGGLI